MFTNLLYNKKGEKRFGILQERLFILGLLVKLSFSILFIAPNIYQSHFTFIDYFLEFSNNPYDFFFSQNQLEAFQYPPLLLWIMAIPMSLTKLCTAFWGHCPSTLAIFLYKVPILLADITILLVLSSWTKINQRKLLLFYWFSPIIIYINYMIGYLESIPIAFLFVALYFLYKNKSFYYTIFFLSLGICTKFGLLLTIPFFIFYRLTVNRAKWSSLIAPLGLIGLLLFLFLYPYIGPGLSAFLFQNNQHDKALALYIPLGNNLKIYIVPAFYFILILVCSQFKLFNKEVMTLFMAITFGILTFFIPPLEGWYIWIIPFFILFITKSRDNQYLYFGVLNIAYFIHFILVKESVFLSIFTHNIQDSIYKIGVSYGFDMLLISNLTFTGLQASLLMFCILIYFRGVLPSLKYKILSQPFLLGIGGNSGAGKTTLTKLIVQIFEENSTQIIQGDDMHKWERGNDNWNLYTHLNPKANNLYEDMRHAMAMKTGNSIQRKHYNHNTGKFTNEKKLKSNKLVIFEGLHPFYIKKQAELFDFKIFIKPQESLRWYWKIERDMAKRSYSRKKVLSQLEKRKSDSEIYIDSQEKQADIVFSFSTDSPIDLQKDPLPDLSKLSLHLKINFFNDIEVEDLIIKLSSSETLTIEYFYLQEELSLIIHGDISKREVELISYEYLYGLEEIGIYNPKWSSGFDGIIQLICMYCILDKLEK